MSPSKYGKRIITFSQTRDIYEDKVHMFNDNKYLSGLRSKPSIFVFGAEVAIDLI